MADLSLGMTPFSVPHQVSISDRDSTFYHALLGGCLQISELLRADRELLCALLRSSVDDVVAGPKLILDFPATIVGEHGRWAQLSPTLHSHYVALGEVVHPSCEDTPATANVPAALCFWVIEMYFAKFRCAREQSWGRSGTMCIGCYKRKANALVSGCMHQYFCRRCLERTRDAEDKVHCPICRRSSGSINATGN